MNHAFFSKNLIFILNVIFFVKNGETNLYFNFFIIIIILIFNFLDEIRDSDNDASL